MNIWSIGGIAITTGIFGFFLGINRGGEGIRSFEGPSSRAEAKSTTELGNFQEGKAKSSTQVSTQAVGKVRDYRDSLEVISIMAGRQATLKDLKYHIEITPEQIEGLVSIRENGLLRLKELETQHSEMIALDSGEEGVRIEAFADEYNVLVEEVESEVSQVVDGVAAVAAFNVIQSKFGEKPNIGHYERILWTKAGNERVDSYYLCTRFFNSDGEEEQQINRLIVGSNALDRHAHLFEDRAE